MGDNTSSINLKVRLFNIYDFCYNKTLFGVLSLHYSNGHMIQKKEFSLNRCSGVCRAVNAHVLVSIKVVYINKIQTSWSTQIFSIN